MLETIFYHYELWLFFKGFIDYCLTCTKLYFSYIQDENTFNNNKKLYRNEGRDRPTATTLD